MSKKIGMWLGTSMLVLALLVACGVSLSRMTTNEAAVSSVSSIASGAVETDTGAATAAMTATMTVTDVLAENEPDHEESADYAWDNTTEVPITLEGDSIVVEGEGASVEGSIVTITAAGTYRISGSLENGQIAVDTTDEDLVRLLLDGVAIHNETSAAINVINAEKVVILLVDGSENTLSDGESYVFANPEEDEPNATLFSTADLTITGSGSLRVDANYNDGIASKDGLMIASGTISVEAIDDGIRGKDYLVVQAGNLTVNAQGDGLKSDNSEETTRGYIAIESGVFQITAGGDAIQAETDVTITGGKFTLSTGGGSNSVLAADLSAKGIKAVVAVQIDGGTFAIDSADDAIHSNGSVTIHNGDFTITSGDDGIHADANLVINGGDIQINQSYEGIESAVITLNAGTIKLVASDDGINVAGGNDSSGMARGPRGGMSEQETFTYTGSEYLYINGGYIVVDAAGDGIDVNGAIEMSGGLVIVNGPTAQGNGALDYDASFNITGGLFVAAGSSGMAQTAGSGSTQPSLLLNFDSAQGAGTLVHLQNSEGETLFTFVPTKQFQSIAFSSPALVTGATYTVYLDGTATGTVQDGLSQDAGYTPGTLYTTFTVEDVVTMIGQSGMNRR